MEENNIVPNVNKDANIPIESAPPSQTRKMKISPTQTTLAIVLLLILAGIGYAAFSMGKENSGPKVVACSLDAKICPDGSSVGRNGPNCEFAPCPISPTPTPFVLGEKIGKVYWNIQNPELSNETESEIKDAFANFNPRFTNGEIARLDSIFTSSQSANYIIISSSLFYEDLLPASGHPHPFYLVKEANSWKINEAECVLLERFPDDIVSDSTLQYYQCLGN